MAVVINEDLCTGCGTCAEVCPEEAITVNDVAHVDPDKCLDCGICVDECANEAMSMPED